MKFWKLGIIFSMYSLLGWAGEYPMPEPGSDLVGENYTIEVQKGDSLAKIREEHGVSYEELLEANPEVNFYRLRIGQQIFIPKQFILPPFREGVVVNVPELRLYYFTPDGKKVFTFPVGLGREQWRTPLFNTKVVDKKIDPSWRVPSSIRDHVYHKTGKLLPTVVASGPSNPLGKYAIYLGIGSYLIHGTNAPSTVGAFISSGCMRMLRAPLKLLYQNIKIGTPVRVIYYPFKAGWLADSLYVEAHKAIDYYENKDPSELNNTNIKQILELSVKEEVVVTLDHQAVWQAIEEHLGVPVVVGSR